MSETPNNGHTPVNAPAPAQAPQQAQAPQPRYFTAQDQQQFGQQAQARAWQAPAAQPRPAAPAPRKARKGFPVFGIPAIVILSVMLVIFVLTTYVSLTNAKLGRGLLNGAFVGLKNYENLLGSGAFPSALATALITKGMLLGAAALLSAGLCALYYAMKKPRTALLFGCLWLIPLCLPCQPIAMALINALGPAAVRSAETDVRSSLVTVLASLLQITGLFCFGGGLFTFLQLRKTGKAGKGPYFGMLIAALVCLLANLNTDMGANLSTYVSSRNLTVDGIIYRYIVQTANFGVGMAASVLKIIFQILIAVVPLVVLCILARKKSTKGKTPLTVLWVFLAFLTVGLILVALELTGLLRFTSNLSLIGSGLFNTVVVAFLAGCLGGLIAYSFVHLMRRSASFLYGVIALVLAASMSCLGAQYILFRDLGCINTYFPMVVLAAFDPRMVLVAIVLGFALRDHMERRPGSLVMAMVLLCAALAWSALQTPLFYLSNASRYPLSLVMYRIDVSASSASALADASARANAVASAAARNAQTLTCRLLLIIPPLLLAAGAALLMKRAFSDPVKG